MMQHEFTERTGYAPTDEEYNLIEQSYYDFNGDKDEFCKAWMKAQKSGAWTREAELLRVIAGLKAENENLTDKLQDTDDLLRKASEDRNYFQKIANGLAKDLEGMQKKVDELKASTPAITICSKSGQTETHNVQAVCYHDNGISFINVVEPSGWITSYRVADMAWFEIRKTEKEA